MSDVFSSVDHPIIVKANEAKHWFTRSVERPTSESLCVEIVAPFVGGDMTGMAGITGTRRSEVDDPCEVIRFNFKDYVSFSVTEERYSSHPKGQVFEGSWTRMYSKSSFLDFVGSNTFCTAHCPELDAHRPYHFQINTYDDTINIVTHHPPEVSRRAPATD